LPNLEVSIPPRKVFRLVIFSKNISDGFDGLEKNRQKSSSDESRLKIFDPGQGQVSLFGKFPLKIPIFCIGPK